MRIINIIILTRQTEKSWAELNSAVHSCKRHCQITARSPTLSPTPTPFSFPFSAPAFNSDSGHKKMGQLGEAFPVSLAHFRRSNPISELFSPLSGHSMYSKVFSIHIGKVHINSTYAMLYYCTILFFRYVVNFKPQTGPCEGRLLFLVFFSLFLGLGWLSDLDYGTVTELQLLL